MIIKIPIGFLPRTEWMLRITDWPVVPAVVLMALGVWKCAELFVWLLR